jgi:uncharacterized protein
MPLILLSILTPSNWFQNSASISETSSNEKSTPFVNVPKEEESKKAPSQISGNVSMANRLTQSSNSSSKSRSIRDAVTRETPLHSVATSGNWEESARLLDQTDVDINATNKNGETALHFAVKHGHTTIVEFFLKRGANIHITNLSGKTALDYAVGNANEGLIRLLLKCGAQVNIKNLPYGNNTGQAVILFHVAVNIGRFDVVQTFIRHAIVHITAVDKEQNTALHLAQKAGHRKMVKFLLANGADVNAKNFQGRTILHNVVSSKNRSLVKFLLKQKDIKINIQDQEGNTALHRAIQERNIKMVKILLRNGVDTHIKNVDGDTPWHCAIIANSKEIAEVLLKRGGTKIVETTNKSGETALHLAIKYGYLSMAQWLLENGANINAKDVQGNTALHYAISLGREDLIKLLLQQKELQINARNNLANTALHCAVMQARTSIVSLLLENNADVSIKNSNGQTVMNFLLGYPMRKLLENAIAKQNAVNSV